MTTRIEIMPIEAVPDAVNKVLNPEYARAFPQVGADGVDDSGIEWTDGEFRVVVWHGGDVAASAVILPRTIKIGATTVHVGGIGGVLTVVHKRGLGLGKTVVRAAADYLCSDLNRDAGFLFCLDKLLPFYASMGWQQLNRPLTYHQSDGAHQLSANNTGDHFMILPCGDFVLPDGDIDLQGRVW